MDPGPEYAHAVSEDLRPKYEDWIRKLEENLAALTRERRSALRTFLVLTGISPLGLIWNRWITLCTILLGVLLWVTTLYITAMRAYQYKIELARTRKDLRDIEARADA